MQPLKQSGHMNHDVLNLIFPPSINPLYELHGQFELGLKQRRVENDNVMGEVGDLLVSLFDGHQGEELKVHAAQFCARQQIALETLRETRKQHSNIQKLLQNAEAHKACRRLQLKDLLPTVLQRLTKYPLLFESLLKVTSKLEKVDERELQAITRALESSRDILNHVNQEVKTAEDQHKLQMIQKKLDRSSFDKEAPSEFKTLDLTQHRLIHDGLLTMKKNPNIQLYGLLFDSMMVLLQKEGEKYILKFHPNVSQPGEKSDVKFNPVTKINLIFVRQSAVDKNAFFLINTNVSQMLELSAPSSAECKNWFRLISEASETYKQRVKRENEPLAQNGATKCVKDALETVPEGENGQADAESIEQTTEVKTESEANLENNNIATSDTTSSSSSTSNGLDLSEKMAAPRRQDSGQNILNNSRRLTQQNSLISPSEIQITQHQNVFIAERVISTEDQLRLLDAELRTVLHRKQNIVCDMFKVPKEDFNVIADIVGETETTEPTELLLAAFAQIQSLTEMVGDHINVNIFREIAARSNALCDNCYKQREAIKNDRNAAVSSLASSVTTPTTMTSTSEMTTVRAMEDEDGYCEIEEIRSEILNNAAIVDTSLHQESQQLAAATGVTVAGTSSLHGTSPSEVGFNNNVSALLWHQLNIVYSYRPNKNHLPLLRRQETVDTIVMNHCLCKHQVLFRVIWLAII